MSFSTANYSVYAIPAYWGLSLLPHAYALSIVKAANNGKWNNSSPRSGAWKEQLNKAIPQDTLKTFERAEAAHNNCLENQALFYTTVVLGNLAGLPAQTLNTFAVGYLAVRVAYVAAYIGIQSNRVSYARTGIYFAGSGLCVWILTKAASVFASRL